MTERLPWTWALLVLLAGGIPHASGQPDSGQDWTRPWGDEGNTGAIGPSTMGTGDWIWRTDNPEQSAPGAPIPGMDAVGKAHDGTALYVAYASQPGQVITDDHHYIGTSAVVKWQSGGAGDEVWKHESQRFFDGTPIIKGERVYVAYNGFRAFYPDREGVPQTRAGILVLDAADGSVRADYQPGYDKLGMLTSFENLLIAVADDGLVVALDLATGTHEWVWEAPLPFITAQPAVGSGRLVVLMSDEGGETPAQSLVAGVDVGTGDLRWTFVPSGVIVAPPAILDSLVFFQDTTSTITALLLELGVPAWANEDFLNAGIRPVVREGLLVTGAYTPVLRPDYFESQVTLKGWNPWTGEPLWSWQAPFIGSFSEGVVLTDNAIFFSAHRDVPLGEEADVLGALDLDTMSLRWIVPAEEWQLFGAGPLMANGRIYLADDVKAQAFDAGAEPITPPTAAFELSPDYGYASGPPNYYDGPVYAHDQSVPGNRPIARWWWGIAKHPLEARPEPMDRRDDIEWFADSDEPQSSMELEFTTGRPFYAPNVGAGPRGNYAGAPGNYTIILEVQDDQGRSSFAIRPFTLLPAELAPPRQTTGRDSPSLGAAGALFALACLAVQASRRTR